MQLLFENAHCQLFLDDTLPALVQVWSGFVAGEPLHEAHEAVIRLLREHHLSRVLADTRTMRVIPRTDQQWITDDFFPRALAAGYRRVAIVQADDAFNQTSIQNILTVVTPGNPIAVEHFQNLESARQWLAAE